MITIYLVYRLIDLLILGLIFGMTTTTASGIKQNKSLTSILAGPVFYITTASKSHSYGEPGLSIALMANDEISGRKLSANYQFESRLGLGHKIDSYDLKFTIFHYSNGDTKGANQGMDILMLSIGLDI